MYKKLDVENDFWIGKKYEKLYMAENFSVGKKY